MSRPHQEIRPSQFITTFGPGSILETRSGPVVIKSVSEIFARVSKSPQDFEILDSRLSRAALGGARITRIPTNAELELTGDEFIYPAERFPFWALCTSPAHSPVQILYQASRGCPRCPRLPDWQRNEKAGREAIRFVLACTSGHLDEVNWNLVAHASSGRGGCQSDHFEWHGGGRALRHVFIECPACGARENFGTAYSRNWRCRGIHREQGNQQNPCASDARISQRGAANLRTVVPVAALTIVDMPSRLHNIVSDRRVLSAATTLRQISQLTQQNLMTALQPQLPAATLAILASFPWQEVLDAVDDLLRQQQGIVRPLLEEEFDRLTRAATSGAPAVPSSQPGAPPLFEVIRGNIRTVTRPNSRITFRVTPVSRLRMVMVQRGYQRMDPQNGAEVSVAFRHGTETWFPGVELFGEGIFIDMPQAPLTVRGPRAQAWQARHANDLLPRTHPVHVWWHTLAHRLLQAFSLDSGYSSAAIRERIYAMTDAAGVTRGGMLLYTVQPGGDGTLGGLIAQTDRFPHLLGVALRDLPTCSNDPLCSDAPGAGAEGSACYSCLLVSETSCEHRNLGLDRLLLLENSP